MTVNANLVFDLGETWIIDHTSCNTDGKTPLDLTGGTVALFVKGSGGSVLTPSQSTSTLVSPTLGTSQLKVTPAQQTSAGVAAQVATYLIRSTLADGTVTDQNIGNITIRASAAT